MSLGLFPEQVSLDLSFKEPKVSLWVPVSAGSLQALEWLTWRVKSQNSDTPRPPAMWAEMLRGRGSALNELADSF